MLAVPPPRRAGSPELGGREDAAPAAGGVPGGDGAERAGGDAPGGAWRAVSGAARKPGWPGATGGREGGQARRREGPPAWEPETAAGRASRRSGSGQGVAVALFLTDGAGSWKKPNCDSIFPRRAAGSSQSSPKGSSSILLPLSLLPGGPLGARLGARVCARPLVCARLPQGTDSGFPFFSDLLVARALHCGCPT